MPPRQIWIFKFGCWVAFVTALVHLAGHLIGPAAPVNDVERQLSELATTYRYKLPGGAERSLMNFLDGFSLMFALLVAALGALGLIVIRRGAGDPALLSATARALAITSAGLLALSLAYFFLVPTAFVALMTICFTLAAVRAPQASSS